MLLEIKNLNCKRGYQQLFSGINLSLNRGDILRITGENGRGKTSILKMIAGFGFIEVGSISLLQYKAGDSSYQKNVIYLGHLNALNPLLSTVDNLLFLVNLKQACSKKQAKYALDGMGLKNYYDDPCSQLSAGQKRRVLLASLLLLDVPLWLLDEPFTTLDSSGIELVENLVLTHAKNNGACLFTTHQNSVLNQYRTLAL